MGIARGWEKRVIRTNITYAKRTVRIFSVSPQSRSLFSASLPTFCLTARAYLNTQKYGLFCSLQKSELFEANFFRHASFFDPRFSEAFRPEGNYGKLNLVGYLNDYCKEQPRNTCDSNSFAYLKTPCL